MLCLAVPTVRRPQGSAHRDRKKEEEKPTWLTPAFSWKDLEVSARETNPNLCIHRVDEVPPPAIWASCPDRGVPIYTAGLPGTKQEILPQIH